MSSACMGIFFCWLGIIFQPHLSPLPSVYTVKYLSFPRYCILSLLCLWTQCSFFPWNALSWWATYHLSFGTEFQYVSSSAWSLLALQAVLSPLSVLTDYNPLVFYCGSWLSYIPPLLTMSSLRTEMSIIHPVFPRLRRTDGVT